VTPTRGARTRLLSLPCAGGMLSLRRIVRVHSWPPCQHSWSIYFVAACRLRAARQRMRAWDSGAMRAMRDVCWRSGCLPCVGASSHRLSHASHASTKAPAAAKPLSHHLVTRCDEVRSQVHRIARGEYPAWRPTPRHPCHSARGGDEDRPPRPKLLAQGREARRCAECCVSRRGRD
jgi:hypothetical protein